MGANGKRITVIAGEFARRSQYDQQLADALRETFRSDSWAVEIIDGKRSIFPGGDRRVTLDSSICGSTAVIVQQYPNKDQNNAFVELLLMLDTVSYERPDRIIVVFLEYPYARQDRRIEGVRGPASANVLSRALSSAIVGNVPVQCIVLDIHNSTTADAFPTRMPAYRLYSRRVWIEKVILPFLKEHGEIGLVTPDVGGTKRVRAFRWRIPRELRGRIKLIRCEKEERDEPGPAVVHVLDDPKGRPCMGIDDLIAGGGTMVACIKALIGAGVPLMEIIATHAVFCGDAATNLAGVHQLRRVHVMDSNPKTPNELAPLGDRIIVHSSAAHAAAGIHALIQLNSLSAVNGRRLTE